MPKHRRSSDDDDDSFERRSLSDSSQSDDDDDPRDRSKRRKDSSKSREKDKKHKKHSKSNGSKRHKKTHRKDSKSSRRRDKDADSYGSDSVDSRSRRKRPKKAKKRRKRPRSETESIHDDREGLAASKESGARSHILTQALCHLFTARPVFAQELPILLIRLAGGSTFDLRQMNDHVASTALKGVLECLEEFGVQKSNTGEWLFQAPPGRKDERVLLRVIRSLLDEVGVTMKAVVAQETKLAEAQKTASTEANKSKMELEESTRTPQDPSLDRIKDLTSNLVLKYQNNDADLAFQLSGLCQSIAKGESISVDGLPDVALKTSLQEIFEECGLEKSEMADDEDSSDEDETEEENTEPTMGYGLPEGADDTIHLRLAAVTEACRNPKRRVLGPTRPTQQEVATTYASEDEEEGPALPGQERRRRGPALPAHLVKAQAEHRELVLKATAAGIEIPTHVGGREEWMVVPGKFDFLSNIKSGQPMKSRGFQNKKTRGDEQDAPVPIHPAIQAEMDSILQAHQDARGPSLMDQHRAKKKQERNAEAGKKEDWKWNRENDLDAGRRVDKDALHEVLGGASDNLKTKFHGGFN